MQLQTHKYYAPVSIMFAGLLMGLSIIYWGHPGSDSPTRRTASHAPAIDHSNELPPVLDAEGRAPYVNMRRLNSIAKETYKDAEKMVAEKADLQKEHRLPASKSK